MLNVPATAETSAPEVSPVVAPEESSKSSTRPAKASFGSLYRETGEVLGEGLNGEVKLAVHKETGNKVALKLYRTASMNKHQLVDLAREVKTQSSIKHPNVAKVEAIYQSANHIRLLVEHLSGGSVFDHIVEEAALSEEHALSVVRQLLSAVEQVHAQGLVHRDIKPENMIYASAEKDKMKLIDFGFCCYWKEGDKPMTRRCGTEAYMAPEVTRQHGYTSLADMWSVGVVAHVLLTGELPGRHSDWTPILSDRLREYSLEAQKFVVALLTADPSKRLTAQQAGEHRWILAESRGKARCDSEISTAACTVIGRIGTVGRLSTECSSDCFSPRKSTDFSPLFPSERCAPTKVKKSLWQALPNFGAGRRVGAALAAVRGNGRASRVSVEVDL